VPSRASWPAHHQHRTFLSLQPSVRAAAVLTARTAQQLEALQPISDVTLRSSDDVPFDLHKAKLAETSQVLRCAFRPVSARLLGRLWPQPGRFPAIIRDAALDYGAAALQARTLRTYGKRCHDLAEATEACPLAQVLQAQNRLSPKLVTHSEHQMLLLDMPGERLVPLEEDFKELAVLVNIMCAT